MSKCTISITTITMIIIKLKEITIVTTLSITIHTVMIIIIHMGTITIILMVKITNTHMDITVTITEVAEVEEAAEAVGNTMNSSELTQSLRMSQSNG